MQQCEFMKLPIERPVGIEEFVVANNTAIRYLGDNKRTVVPVAYNGEAITAVSCAYNNCESIKVATISSGITSID